MSHGKVVCGNCRALVSQCRCLGGHVNVTYVDGCDRCQRAKVPPVPADPCAALRASHAADIERLTAALAESERLVEFFKGEDEVGRELVARLTAERDGLARREEAAWREIRAQAQRNQRLVEDLHAQTSPTVRMVVKQRDAAEADRDRLAARVVELTGPLSEALGFRLPVGNASSPWLDWVPRARAALSLVPPEPPRPRIAGACALCGAIAEPHDPKCPQAFAAPLVPGTPPDCELVDCTTPGTHTHQGRCEHPNPGDGSCYVCRCANAEPAAPGTKEGE